MKIFKTAYLALAERIFDKCPSIEHIDLWQEQSMNNEITYELPAVFIEFADFDWQREGSGRNRTQLGAGTIMVRVEQVKYSDSLRRKGYEPINQDDALQRFDVVQEVQDALEGWATDYMQGLERKSSPSDVSGDEITIDSIGYATVLRDVPNPATGKYTVDGMITGIDVNKGVPERVPDTDTYIIEL